MKAYAFLIIFNILGHLFLGNYALATMKTSVGIDFNITSDFLTISGIEGKIVNISRDDSSMNYEYILETPFFEITGVDGVINPIKSKGLKNFPKDDFLPEDFPKFSFFTEEKNTIGILIGFAGSSGGSTQTVYFINTQTGDFLTINSGNLASISWAIENGRPVGYKEFDTSFYFGSHATSWGYKPRVDRIVFFDETGKTFEDKQELTDLYKKEFDQIIFTEDEEALLQDNIMSDMQYRSLGQKLVDYVFYGMRSGQKDTVIAFLKTVHPVYLEEAIN